MEKLLQFQNGNLKYNGNDHSTILTKMKKDFKKSDFVIISMSFLIVIILHRLLEFSITKILINNLFNYIDSNWYTDAILIVLSLGSLVYFLRPKQMINASLNLCIVATLIIILYGYYRINFTKWQFIEFSFAKDIKYLDTILLYYFIILYGWLLPFFYKKAEPEKNILSEDLPLKTDTENSRYFTLYANRIADVIQTHSFYKSFAIGINGSWGFGKTTLVDLVLKKLENDKKNIIIQFNPWRSFDHKAMIADFFNEIRQEVSPHNKSFNSLISTYTDKLLSTNEGGIFSGFYKFINSTPTINEIFDQINSRLEKLDKKLIITIDDIDRLSNEEVMEVLKLVRNTANFRNTVFLLMYDRNYIEQAINKANSFHSDFYLEKIIQMEIALPTTEKTVITNSLIDKLKEVLPAKQHRYIKESIDGSREPLYILNWVKNFRDINRIVNSMALNYDLLEGEIVYKDFFRLELLRLYFPNVYNLIKYNSSLYLNQSDPKYGRIQYKLGEKGSVTRNNLMTKIQYLYPSVDPKIIETILLLIFPNTIGTIDMFSVVFQSNFDKYFRYTVGDHEFSELVFDDALQNGFEAMKPVISAWVGKGLGDEVKLRFSNISIYTDEKNFDCIIHSIFYLANQTDKNSKWIIGYNYKELTEKLNLYYEKNSNPFPIERRKYFISLVESATDIKCYEVNYLFSLLFDPNMKLILERQELENLFTDIITKIWPTINLSNNDLYVLYDYTFPTVNFEHQDAIETRSRIVPELRKIIIDILNKCTKTEIVGFLSFEISGDKKIRIDYINNIWPEKDAFKSFMTLNTTPEALQLLSAFER